jgi:hypothetical protein
MFSRWKKRTAAIKPDIFTIRWYPNSRSCSHVAAHRIKPQQMPPLMVRKAEWRR